MQRHLPEGPKPPLVRPINYSRLISGATVLMGAVTLFSVLSPYILPIIQNRNLWAAMSLMAILLFTSGHMFNHIRKAPYVVGDGKGGISYFAAGFTNQFGMETQVVAAICKWSFPAHRWSCHSSHLILILFSRCCPLLCNDCTRHEGPSHGRRQIPAGRCRHLGRCTA